MSMILEEVQQPKSPFLFKSKTSGLNLGQRTRVLHKNQTFNQQLKFLFSADLNNNDDNKFLFYLFFFPVHINSTSLILSEPYQWLGFHQILPCG